MTKSQALGADSSGVHAISTSSTVLSRGDAEPVLQRLQLAKSRDSCTALMPSGAAHLHNQSQLNPAVQARSHHLLLIEGN